ncbi:hypothetical protein [Maribacter sp. ACAM166]|uniref:hypothetical protein n=1 Tax=Maribacter sp. ACAM166 TaxID=2508996 RepID=UPI0010FD9004|nr:hypothetical protein [Maribacter sp. ACAM166]TLP73252.1 hypothetical protein ES765_17465 [Maribacter sp. ACAM166]
MAKEKCPNCGQFKFEESRGFRLGCGVVLTFVVPFLLFLAPGSAQSHGGYLDGSALPTLVIGSVSIGVILISLYFIFPPKTRLFKCENCDFQQHYEK